MTSTKVRSQSDSKLAYGSDEAIARVLTSADLLEAIFSALTVSTTSDSDALVNGMYQGVLVGDVEALRRRARGLVAVRRVLLSTALTSHAFALAAVPRLRENARQLHRTRQRVRAEDAALRWRFTRFAEIT